MTRGCSIAVKASVGHAWGMTRADPPLRIRLPAELKATIQASAAKNRRSMNAEIVARLDASFVSHGEANSASASESGGPVASLSAEVAELRRRVEKLEAKRAINQNLVSG